MTVEAFAKVNLTLEVFGVRTDGYHALRSLVAPISLSDTVEVEDALELSSDVPYPDDLCLKAARVLRSTAGSGASLGASIRVTKRIPAGGGLGGGSADAAATLLALNDVWGLMLSPEELAEIASQVGSDVPALVLANRYRRPVVMEGRGERVELLPADACGEPLQLVLANPGVATSTKAVYANCTGRVADDARILYNIRTALKEGDPTRLAAAFMNDLVEPACRLHPEIADALASLRTAGATGVLMSGSGSSVFGLVPTEARGREIAALLKAKGLAAWSVHTLVR